jgi:hypothetical protein
MYNVTLTDASSFSTCGTLVTASIIAVHTDPTILPVETDTRDIKGLGHGADTDNVRDWGEPRQTVEIHEAARITHRLEGSSLDVEPGLQSASAPLRTCRSR